MGDKWRAWDVVGGAGTGGILVRHGRELDSAAFKDRLVTGALIKELALEAQRMHYTLLKGTGPTEGWISTSIKGKAMVAPAQSTSALGLEGLLLRHASDTTFSDLYVQGDQLGSGGFASVYLAEHVITGETRAVKKLQYRKQEELLKIDSECRVLVKLDHPHIMKFYEFFCEPDTVYLVTEFCTGGTIADFFQESKWDMEDARVLFHQMISAVHYCHRMGVIHHDLKPQNCTLLQHSARPFVKVIDFGIASLKASRGIESCPRSDALTKSLKGTPFWRAPEVLDPDGTSGPEADLYCVGLIMFLCLTGTHPLHKGLWGSPMGVAETLDMYSALPEEDLQKAKVPKAAANLTLELLSIDKSKRPDAKTALEHPWFEADFEPESTASSFGKRFSYSGLEDIDDVDVDSSSSGSGLSSGSEGEMDHLMQVFKCPAGHNMQGFVTDEDGWSCSKCGSEFLQGTTLHGCRECDIDWCKRCAKKTTRPKKTSKKMGRTSSVGGFEPSLTFGHRGSARSARLLARVLRYTKLESWHCVILRLIAHNSNELEVLKQRERFKKYDTDQSSSLGRQELMTALQENGFDIDDAEIDELLRALDSRGTGEIEYSEWIASTLKASIIVRQEVMKMVFEFFDLKHRGSFGNEELTKVLGPKVAQDMLARADVEEFTWESFMALMQGAATDRFSKNDEQAKGLRGQVGEGARSGALSPQNAQSEELSPQSPACKGGELSPESPARKARHETDCAWTKPAAMSTNRKGLSLREPSVHKVIQKLDHAKKYLEKKLDGTGRVRVDFIDKELYVSKGKNAEQLLLTIGDGLSLTWHSRGLEVAGESEADMVACLDEVC